MIHNISKYFDADEDIFVMIAKSKFIENLLSEGDSSLDDIAKLVEVNLDFVIAVQQKLALEEQL